MGIVDELSGFFLQYGIDPLIGGFMLGISVCVLVRVLAGENKNPAQFSNNEQNSVVSITNEKIFNSHLNIKIKTNGIERELNTNESEKVLSLIQSGNKIEAIKYVREISGMGLKEAKDLVDILEKSNQ